MLKKIALILMFVALVLSGCSSAAATRSANIGAAPQAMPDVYNGEKAAGAPAYESDYNGAGSTGSSIPSDTAAERLVIQNANLTILVASPADAMSAVQHMATEMGGFVVTSNLYKTYVSSEAGELPEANITVRVPSARLNDALAQVKALTQDPEQDVKSETISGQDVTKEYTDLRSRLKNLEDTEAQLREIMGSATKTEDVLSVYRELTNIREQIEVIKGQIQYYEEAAAMSSIAIVIQAKASVQPIEIGGWQPGGVARESIQALVKALQTLADIGIRVVLFILPLAAVMFFPLWLIWFIVRRVRKNRRQPTPTA